MNFVVLNILNRFWGLVLWCLIFITPLFTAFVAFVFESESPNDESFVKKVGEHAEQTNAFATALEKYNQMRSENLEEDFVYSLETTKARFGIEPDPLLIKALITSGEINSYFGLEKWLLAWEIENVPNEEILEPAYTLDWFIRSAMNQLQVLCLLPTTNCWEVLSFWEFYGGTEIPMAMIKYWHKKYGAELVAHFGTMLQFVVAKPPQNLEQAFQLACEQESIAFCTTGTGSV